MGKRPKPIGIKIHSPVPPAHGVPKHQAHGFKPTPLPYNPKKQAQKPKPLPYNPKKPPRIKLKDLKPF